MKQTESDKPSPSCRRSLMAKQESFKLGSAGSSPAGGTTHV